MLLEIFFLCVVEILGIWFNMCPAKLHQILFCSRQLLGFTVPFGTLYNDAVKGYVEKVWIGLFSKQEYGIL